jgi:hypothetical protein
MPTPYNHRMVLDLEPYQAAILDYYAERHYRTRPVVLKQILEHYARSDVSFRPAEFSQFVDACIAPQVAHKGDRCAYLRGQVRRFLEVFTTTSTKGVTTC